MTTKASPPATATTSVAAQPAAAATTESTTAGIISTTGGVQIKKEIANDEIKVNIKFNYVRMVVIWYYETWINLFIHFNVGKMEGEGERMGYSLIIENLILSEESRIMRVLEVVCI